MSTTDIAVVDRIIRQRRTNKIMLSPDLAAQAKSFWTRDHHDQLVEMIEGAAWAPFHRRADAELHRSGSLSAAMPWRFHVLEGQACIDLIAHLKQQGDTYPDSKWSRAWQSKIKDMLSACGALVQVTWLPDPEENGGEPTLTVNNSEHIAGASAAVQNVLLAAEARGWQSYWSSGGILRDPDIMTHLGIGARESLLGSVFLSPHVHEKAVQKAGGLRDERSDPASWVRWL